jgi:peroxiredoxin
MKKISFLIILVGIIAGSSIAQMQTDYPGGLKIGDTAPLFKTRKNDGGLFNLKAELKKGEVVVIFYRGYWCPYCNKQLSKLNDSLQMITEKGATVIAITPETAENINKTVEKTKAAFAFIEDKGMAIMKSYKVNFAVDENTIARYKNFGIDFDKSNGANGANLPVPATYIIGKDRKIKYVFFNTDYRLRATVKDILDNL